MKTLSNILLLSAIIISISSTAQTFTNPGTTELGGALSYSSQSITQSGSTASATQSTFSFSPYLGLMVSEGFEIGLMPGIVSVVGHNYDITYFNFFVAPSYNINTKSNAYPFLEFLLGYNSVASGSSNGGNESGMGIGADAGVKVNVSGNSLLLLQIQYLSQNYESKNNSSNYYPNGSYYPSTVSETLSTISFGVGFRVFFQKNSETKKIK